MPELKNEVARFFIDITYYPAITFANLFFIPFEAGNYPVIRIEGFTMKVVVECTAYSFYIFAIFLSLLSSGSWKKRIINLLIFVGVIFLANNIRFLTMGVAGAYYPDIFRFMHDYLWDFLFGILVFLTWLWRINGPLEPEKPEL